MARKFNLQPWREQRRDEQKKNFTYASLGIVLLCAAALGADYWQQTNYIEEQKSAISQLEENINKLSTRAAHGKAIDMYPNPRDSHEHCGGKGSLHGRFSNPPQGAVAVLGSHQ